MALMGHGTSYMALMSHGTILKKYIFRRLNYLIYRIEKRVSKKTAKSKKKQDNR